MKKPATLLLYTAIGTSFGRPAFGASASRASMEALDTMRLVPSFHESNIPAFISCDTRAELTPSIRAASAAVTAGVSPRAGGGGPGDNLAAVSRLMSEVWHGKFNAVRIKELEFPCVNQVRPPLMAKNTRRTPRSIASRIDAANHAYLKASRGLEFQCRLAPSCRIPEVTKM